MTARARDAKTKEQVYIDKFNNDKEMLLTAHPNGFIGLYPDVDFVVVPVSASHRSKLHFRYPSIFKTEYDHHPESLEHQSGKDFLVDMLRKEELYKGLSVETEFPVICETGKKRIIDVVVLKDGVPIEAHEVQLSPQTPAQLTQRTDDYLSSGILVEWYFGGAAEAVGKDWALRHFGYARTLIFSAKREGVAA